MPPPSRLSSSLAVSIIESAWIRYRDRQLFQILKVAVRTLEMFLGADILRRTAPKDFELLRDTCIPFTLRFRFSGTEFPPVIVFKIYTDSVAIPTQYLSPAVMNGHQQVVDKDKFYADLVKVRGSHSVTAQLLKDEILHTQYGILSPEECVTTKDVCKLKALRDELPAYMGGKGNTWRKLTLADVPRMTILHDVLGFAVGPKIMAKLHRKSTKEERLLIPDSRRIRAILPYLVANNDLQVHFRVLTTVCRNADTTTPAPSSAALTLLKADTPAFASAERRRVAKARAKKLLQLYSGQPTDRSKKSVSQNVLMSLMPESDAASLALNSKEMTNLSMSFFDQEAEELFEWSRNLPPEDEIV